MSYKVKQPTVVDEVKAVADWAYDEFKALEQNFLNLDRIRLVEQFSAPLKARTGDTVLADGTTWNPGSGAGVYTYYAGMWNKLG